MSSRDGKRAVARMRIAVTISSFVAAGALFGAPASAVTAKDCGMPLAVPVGDGRVVHTLLKRDSRDPSGRRWKRGDWIACDRQVGVWRKLANERRGSWIYNRIYMARGSLVAYNLSRSCEEPCNYSELRVMNLSTGRTITHAPLLDDPSDFYYRLKRVRLALNGTLVVAGTRRSEVHPESIRRRIVKLGPGSARSILDEGRDVRLNSLKIHRDTASWRHARRHRSVRL